MPSDVENPFKKVYEDGYKGKKAKVDRTSIVHETPTEEQMRQIWKYVKTQFIWKMREGDR